jgi:hypothetical protein
MGRRADTRARASATAQLADWRSGWTPHTDTEDLPAWRFSVHPQFNLPRLRFEG